MCATACVALPVTQAGRGFDPRCRATSLCKVEMRSILTRRAGKGVHTSSCAGGQKRGKRTTGLEPRGSMPVSRVDRHRASLTHTRRSDESSSPKGQTFSKGFLLHHPYLLRWQSRGSPTRGSRTMHETVLESQHAILCNQDGTGDIWPYCLARNQRNVGRSPHGHQRNFLW